MEINVFRLFARSAAIAAGVWVGIAVMRAVALVALDVIESRDLNRRYLPAPTSPLTGKPLDGRRD